MANVFSTTLYVNSSGGVGKFKNIQEAVQQVPPNNTQWIRIFIEAGEYKEQVTIPSTKPFVCIEGSGKNNTKVEWDRHDSIVTEATFMSLADNTVVKHITFINTYNFPPGHNTNPQIQAVAVMVDGDKTAFYDVAFLGVQDTLFDAKGRHYFNSCFIEGKVDFIFGAGQSIYQSCTISVNGPGSITAQGRENVSDTNGFVFKDCKIVGNGINGKTLLGRAWKEYARVFFFNTWMENIVDPRRWCKWNNKNEKNLTFGELGCGGPGAVTSGRVRYATDVTPAMVEEFGNIKYVDEDNWIAKQP